MRPSERMCWKALWLLALLALSSLSSLADGSPMKVMSAPNLLRVGAAENIFVQCQDCSGNNIRVQIRVLNHPTKAKTLATTTVTLTGENNFQGLGQIIIPADDFSEDPYTKQYVNLVAQFPDFEMEKVVLVSSLSGYIFIQTDKTLYTPDSTVLYRLFAVMPNMMPVERTDVNLIDGSVIIEFVNPDGIVFPENIVHVKSGIFSGSYKLTDIASLGQWKVVTKFSSNPQLSFSAEFEVKEYVLPSFEVKLEIAGKPFFKVDQKQLTVNIRAKYLFDKNVEGTAYVVFGVLDQGQKKSLPSSLQRLQIKEGQGEAKLLKDHITTTFPNMEALVGSSIFAVVSVLTDSGSEMVEAELEDIQIVKSPYNIHFTKTPKYYKPGMPFGVVIEVTNPDGTPAKGITVVLHPGKVKGFTAASGLARLDINTEEGAGNIAVTASVEGEASTASMEAQPYFSQSKTYISIGLSASEVKIGTNLNVNLNLQRSEDVKSDVTYLILSRGQLIKSGHYKKRSVIAMTLPITKDMLPSFRITVYCFTNSDELVSDSVWVDVDDSCMGSLTLESQRVNKPGGMFSLKVTGDPEATVGLVAVDKGVYVLNNKHRLTQKKVWDVIEKGDPGCSPGGGRDSMGVFSDAGLLFHYNTAGTPIRPELKCRVPSRRKRASTILEVRTSLMSRYKEKKQRECCLDGMKDSPLSYDCDRRSQYIVDDPACVAAFLLCCRRLEDEQDERRTDGLLLARSVEAGNDYSDITSRTKFPESWLWIDMKLPACPQHAPNCGTTTSSMENNVLKDSITTWLFTGISLSRTHGICVGEPLEVVARKDFFIDLRLPYSAVRGEQIEIKAVLHNLTPNSVTVRVELVETQDVCSSASARGRFLQEVSLGAHSAKSVPFIIIPMKDGQFPIEVKAVVKGFFVGDGVRKMLRVVPEGVLRKSLKSITLDPVHEGEDGKQEKTMNAEILLKNLVPNTPRSTHIYVAGREQVGALVENAISGKSMGSLIQQPSGCGEQNIASMTLPVIATTYLDRTNQWETVGYEKRGAALQHIKTGYSTELNFRKDDGSFSVFPDRKSSTWLTAYVSKVFAMAYKLVPVSQADICQAVKFLILKAQQHDGDFKELGEIIHGEMIGDVRGKDSDASLPAFCLIAMQESRSICNSTVASLGKSIDKTVQYLERKLPTLTNPYAVAMTSYALANENKLDRQILYNFASGSSHWPVQGSDLFTLEATAYALLALVKAKRFQDAKPVVRWFNQKQIYGGGYGSTQATILVYQAIAEYWVSANEHDYNVAVDIVHPDRKIPDGFSFNKNTQHVTRSSKMLSVYYALPQERESDCRKFNLSVQLIPVTVDKLYKLTIHVLFKEKDRNATMTLLDIGLPTGFEPEKKDLDSLSTGHAATILQYEMNNLLSERGSVVIYLPQVSNVQTEEIAFRVHKRHKVGVLQPAAVSVYEYYDHDNNNQTACVKFYHPERSDGQLLTLCTSNECKCAEENCSMQKKEKIKNEHRTRKVCESNRNNKIDFVYKVTLENFTSDLSTDTYTMRVVEITKEEPSDRDALHKLRRFISLKHCRVGLNLREGKSYLIMGSAKDIYKDKEKHSFMYVLGERTWIEYWPTEEECQTPEHSETCLGIEEMNAVYQIFGCDAK